MRQPVPVMLMARELGLGGSERQLTEIAKNLDRSRFTPHVGCFRPEGIRAEELRRAGIPVVQFPVTSLPHLSTLAAALRMRRYLTRHQIHLVHTFDAPTNLFGVPAAKAFQTPVVISSQRAHRDLTPGLTRHLLRLTDRIANAIVVNCDVIRRHLIEDEKVPSAQIQLCYNGLDTEEFRPLDGGRLPALREAGLVVGVVCALRPEKNLPILIDAFQIVRATHPGLKLLIVGRGPCLPELETRSKALGIHEDCLFEGATDRVADWLRSIDIFVLPSLSEALSNSLMEAMACGCAVVASRVGGNSELISHRRTGMLFESGNLSELVCLLSELIETPALRSALSVAASSFVRENFSVVAAALRMAQIYSTFLESA